MCKSAEEGAVVVPFVKLEDTVVQPRLLSLIPRVHVDQAFEQVLLYYCPPPKVVVDSTASDMKMWSDRMKEIYNPITFDIDPKKNPKHVASCATVDKCLDPHSVDCVIYDPPYVDLSKRKDTDAAEERYGYELVSTLEDFEKLTKSSAEAFWRVLREDGVLICKVTNFHWDGRLCGTYHLREWLREYFYLWDEVVYWYYKNIPNLNRYKKKVPKTHSYFLIFKKLP